MPREINIKDVYQTFTMPLNNQNRYQIRLMNETDIAIVFAIDQITWKDQSWPLKQFFHVLKDPLYKCWILENTTTDYLVLGYGFQYSSDDISHITNFCIHPNRRQRGLGGILLRHMIDYAREHGDSTIELEVHTSNTHAYMLYIKHGLRISRFLPQYYSEYSDAYQMKLIL